MDVSHHQSAAKGMMGCCSFPFLFRFEVSPSSAAAAALVKKADGDDDVPEMCAAVHRCRRCLFLVAAVAH